MKKFLRNAILLVPLFAVAACGPSAPKEDPYDKYKPTEAEWTANIERIKTGNMSATIRLSLGNQDQTILMQATATKISQQIIGSGFMGTNLIVKDGDTYTLYYKANTTKWSKEASSAEDFAELKEGLLPITLKYSNFVWGGETFKMTNVEPIVDDDGEDKTTLTNVVVSITPSTKEIVSIEANIINTDGTESKTGTLKVTYTYKDAGFDIDVPDVE